MGWGAFVGDLVAKWLGIVPVERNVQVLIREDTTRELTTLKNQLWYRGDPIELEQFFWQLGQYSLDGWSRIPQTRFWAAVPTQDNLIRKFHSGLPRLIVDKLAQIVADDMNDPEMDQAAKSRWEEIAKESNFDKLLKKAITKVLSEGDGAFKIALDTDISDKPLIEFYSGNNVDYRYRRGKLMEIIFFTDYYQGTKRYRLCEHYGRGYVKYVLKDSNDKEVDLGILPETALLQEITYDGDFIMGVPLSFYDSAKFEHRGDSILESKSDIFDALDEVLSTWLDSVRAGRVKQYIPESLIPRDEDTGALRKPDVFNAYVVKNTDLGEEADNKIEVVQGKIEYDGLLGSYVTLLDAALQGLISPSTLGIDVKKLDNAESQREKEKATMYTRDTIVGVLMKVLPCLVEIALKCEDHLNGQAPGEYENISFEWGQYANPSFEAMVETVGKAKQYGIMSTERVVEELYGDTLTADKKAVEVARIKAESNPTVQLEEPAVNDHLETGKGGQNPPVAGEGNGAAV